MKFKEFVYVILFISFFLFCVLLFGCNLFAGRWMMSIVWLAILCSLAPDASDVKHSIAEFHQNCKESSLNDNENDRNEK